MTANFHDRLKNLVTTYEETKASRWPYPIDQTTHVFSPLSDL